MGMERLRVRIIPRVHNAFRVACPCRGRRSATPRTVPIPAAAGRFQCPHGGRWIHCATLHRRPSRRGHGSGFSVTAVERTGFVPSHEDASGYAGYSRHRGQRPRHERPQRRRLCVCATETAESRRPRIGGEDLHGDENRTSFEAATDVGSDSAIAWAPPKEEQAGSTREPVLARDRGSPRHVPT